MDETSIAARCDALLGVYRDQDCDPSAELLPGWEPAALRAATAWFRAELPDALVDLYAWRGGQPQDAWNTTNVFWFRDMQFTSIDRVRREYESMLEAYGSDNSREVEGVDLRACFPFASFNGGWYVIACNGQDIDPAHPFPVIAVFCGIDVYFHSIESMLDTCVAWRWASEKSDDLWSVPEGEEMPIWRRFNPGVFPSSP